MTADTPARPRTMAQLISESLNKHTPTDIDGYDWVCFCHRRSTIAYAQTFTEHRAEELTKLLRPFDRVAHKAWHLLDDGGEADTADSNGVVDFIGSGVDAKELSDALDELEATGWDAHPDA